MVHCGRLPIHPGLNTVHRMPMSRRGSYEKETPCCYATAAECVKMGHPVSVVLRSRGALD